MAGRLRLVRSDQPPWPILVIVRYRGHGGEHLIAMIKTALGNVEGYVGTVAQAVSPGEVVCRVYCSGDMHIGDFLPEAAFEIRDEIERETGDQPRVSFRDVDDVGSD